MNLVPFGVAILFFAVCHHSIALAQGGPALVELAAVVDRDVASGQTFVGTVMPTRRAVIGSAVDGRVIDVMFEEGDRVEKDQPLAQLLTQTIELELAAATAELELRQQQLNELENGSLPEEINQSRARMERARIAAQFRQKDFERLTLLSQKRASSQSELDMTQSAALEAQEAYGEARAAHQLAVDGPRPELIAQAKAQVAIQQAVADRLADQIKKYTIASRFAGYVTVKDTDIGEWATQGGAIAEVIALDEVDVVAKVVDSHVPFINVGDAVRVEVPALADHVFTGRVAAIVPQADVRSRTFPVKIRVSNQISESSEPLLKAGMLARVTLATGDTKQAQLVPKDALVLGGDQPVVWLVDPATIAQLGGGARQAKAVAVPVQLGVAEGELIQVMGAIPAGSLVVVKGNERIIPDRTGKPSLVNLLAKARSNSANARSDSAKSRSDSAKARNDSGDEAAGDSGEAAPGAGGGDVTD